MQHGFRSYSRGTDAVLTLKLLASANPGLHTCFIDLQQKIDTVPRRLTQAALDYFEIDIEWQQRFWQTYRGHRFRVRRGGELGEPVCEEIGCDHKFLSTDTLSG